MLPTTTSSTSQRAVSTDRLALDTIDLVRRILVMFPQLADGAVDRKAMVGEWALGLADMRPEEVARGLAACRTRRFPPSLGEFAHLCRPALDPEVAWHEAYEGLRAREGGEPGVWSHPAVFRAARIMGYELRTQHFAAVRKRWGMTLNREFAAGWGEEVPAPAARIEKQELGSNPIPPEIRKRFADLSDEYRSRKGKSTRA